MQKEHFNENYIESYKFPKSTFKGKINNLDDINFAKDSTYPAGVAGKMTIHGVTKYIATKENFIVKGRTIVGTSTFNIAPADYNIEIPKIVSEKIAKEIKVTVNNTYEPFKK